ncbi:unnamed protein product [Protopolystoma xenopodis]|uniref:Uncharacterized protein n=1 Tax=Protopolystoma xenopodis TaxID=117903 RepID=A0A448X033_9PLAT|nr:unnamed protein product [Protopolystoma xenopodis]
MCTRPYAMPSSGLSTMALLPLCKSALPVPIHTHSLPLTATRIHPHPPYMAGTRLSIHLRKQVKRGMRWNEHVWPTDIYSEQLNARQAVEAPVDWWGIFNASSKMLPKLPTSYRLKKVSRRIGH